MRIGVPFLIMGAGFGLRVCDFGLRVHFGGLSDLLSPRAHGKSRGERSRTPVSLILRCFSLKIIEFSVWSVLGSFKLIKVSERVRDCRGNPPSIFYGGRLQRKARPNFFGGERPNPQAQSFQSIHPSMNSQFTIFAPRF